MTRLSRRELLRRAAAIGTATTFAPLAMNLAAVGRASAATGGYKALVCVFLYGGNDAYNTVLATDSASWSAYNTSRNIGTTPIALLAPGAAAQKSSSNFQATLGGVLPITPANSQGRSFALHPLLGSLRDMFAAGRLGVVANVGPLLAPTTKANYLDPGFAKPAKLFSHNDQQATWQTLGVEGTEKGWGGQLVDPLLAGNTQQIFSSISVNGNVPWLVGSQTRMYQLSTNGSIHIGGMDGTLFGSAGVQQQLLDIARNSRSTNLIEADHTAAVGRSIDADAILQGVLPAAGAGPWGTSGLQAGATDPLLTYHNPDTGYTEVNPLAQQLQAVARMIAAQGSLGMGRQIFFVGLQGFDTHYSLPRAHAVGMARLAHALGYFDSTLAAMGASQNVTTFTASDFGRAFESNGVGADHGWGGHHFVMGGAVKGGDIYGAFPAYGVSDGQGGFTSPDQLAVGALLPKISVDQYAATLGLWFGVSASQLGAIFPNLAHFPAAQRTLGFMSA
jgi:uncharacterized protein (DUF1501 family)